MKFNIKYGAITLFYIFSNVVILHAKENKNVINFNNNWKFQLSDSANYSFINYNDDSWRLLNLPHDWSVEFPFDSIKGEGCTGYLPGGIGWYSKHFTTQINDNQKCFIVFDGVYNNSEYWINAKKIAIHPYGYSPILLDITDYLNPKGQDNRIAVRVDHSRYADSRWYTGSGIYRNVKMTITDKAFIPVWGTYITTTSVTKEKATVNIQIEFKNEYATSKNAEINTAFINSSGVKVAETKTVLQLAANSKKEIEQQCQINQPALWSVDHPNLYKAISTVRIEGNEVQKYITSFGIRTIRFDADKGFFLNGKNMKIKGVCLHHDAGIVGAAVPKDVWRRRLQTLKEGGCNAIRMSHNPASDELLDLCDEMGFLVQEEFFDEWDYPKDKRLNMKEKSVDYITRGYTEHFQEWGERDLKIVMRRDRNRACIFQWSIGNEIEWTYEGNKEATGFFGADANGGYFWNQPPYSKERIRENLTKMPVTTYNIGKTAQKLANWTREMDSTRPVIANCILPSVSFESGYADALDIVGFSYRRVMYDYAKKNYPDKCIMGTENLGQWHEWKAIQERDFVSGTFLWTGIDYMGERNGLWPVKSLASGLLDLAGFEKPSYYMMQSLWTEKPMLAIFSQKIDKSIFKVDEKKNVVEKKKNAWERALWIWHDVNNHWNYSKNDSVIVEIYSNCETIELFQNGKSLGKKNLKDFADHIYKWAVNFKVGKLLARGMKDGKKVEATVCTTTEPAAIKISIDKKELMPDGTQVAHVTAQLVDKKNKEIKWTDELIEFNVQGSCKVLGVDNGKPDNVTPFQTTKVLTNQGRCMLILQAGFEKSEITVSAKSKNFKSNIEFINIIK